MRTAVAHHNLTKKFHQLTGNPITATNKSANGSSNPQHGGCRMRHSGDHFCLGHETRMPAKSTSSNAAVFLSVPSKRRPPFWSGATHARALACGAFAQPKAARHTCPLQRAVDFSVNLPSPSFTQLPAECAVAH
jgi:hypothetical protein